MDGCVSRVWFASLLGERQGGEYCFVARYVKYYFSRLTVTVLREGVAGVGGVACRVAMSFCGRLYMPLGASGGMCGACALLVTSPRSLASSAR